MKSRTALRHWLKVGLILLLPIVGFGLFLVVEHCRGEYELKAFKNSHAKDGNALEVSRFRVVQPANSENGFAEFVKLASALSAGRVLPRVSPPAMKMVSPGRAAAGSMQEQWKDIQTYHWSDVAADLETNGAMLAQLQKTLNQPFFFSDRDYSNGFNGISPGLAEAVNASKWLLASFQYSMLQGRKEQALDSLVAAINTTRVIENEHLMLSEHARAAIGFRVFAGTWEALQTNIWSDAELQRLQRTWEGISFVTNMTRALTFEAAVSLATHDSLRKKSNDEVFKLSQLPDIMGSPQPEPSFFEKEIVFRCWRFGWFSHNGKIYAQGLCELARDHRPGAQKLAQSSLSLLNEYGKMNSFNKKRLKAEAILLSGAWNSDARVSHPETYRSLVLCAIALKRHELAVGKPVSTLLELTPLFLSSIPLDPMDGKPMKYRLNTDETWSLYSVGDNGADDGGDPASSVPKSKSLAYWASRDVLWPRLASQDEFASFEKSQ